MTRIGIAATAHYLPERWLTAAEIGELSGIPEQVLVEKFGLRGKHIAAADEHVSDLSVKAVERLLEE
ncbi:MAG: 3-oxoacyl-ACP synthase, partial [Gaiellaceae bacterium]